MFAECLITYGIVMIIIKVNVLFRTVPAWTRPVSRPELFTLYIKNTFSGEVSGSCWLFSSHFSFGLERDEEPALNISQQKYNIRTVISNLKPLSHQLATSGDALAPSSRLLIHQKSPVHRQYIAK